MGREGEGGRWRTGEGGGGEVRRSVGDGRHGFTFKICLCQHGVAVQGMRCGCVGDGDRDGTDERDQSVCERGKDTHRQNQEAESRTGCTRDTRIGVVDIVN